MMKPLNITNTSEKVVTIGFFDGLHLGHIKIINELLSYDLCKVIFTFDDSILKKFKNQEVITPFNIKINLLNKFDIDFFEVLNDDLLDLTALEFIKYLEKINVKVLICGLDFKFGKDFKDANYLKENSDIKVVIVDDYYVNNKKLSSSYIRNMIKNDDLALANTYLNHVLVLNGNVIYKDNKYALNNLSINHSLLNNHEYQAFFNNQFIKVFKNNDLLYVDYNLKDYISKNININIIG